MSRNAYVTAGRLAELRWQLSPDQWAVLDDVATMRVAATPDLQTLHSLRTPLRVRQFRNQLKQLHELGVLARLDRVIGGKSAGSRGFLYVVGPAGQRLLAAEATQPVRRAWTPRPSWLRHALSASHLYVILRQLEKAERLRLDVYQAEPACWRAMPDGWIKPDAFVRVELEGYQDSYFIEVDCGTESPQTLALKAQRYQAYANTGTEQAAHGVFPLVLWLTPSAKRAAVIGAVVERLSRTEQRLHRVAEYEHAAGVFSGRPP